VTALKVSRKKEFANAICPCVSPSSFPSLFRRDADGQSSLTRIESQTFNSCIPASQARPRCAEQPSRTRPGSTLNPWTSGTYIQDEVNRHPEPGRFVLTGSQHLGLARTVSESVAGGRTAVIELLPPSLDELQRFPSAPADLMTTLWMGAYPRILEAGIEPSRWYSDYVTTYVQRDVRSPGQHGPQPLLGLRRYWLHPNLQGLSGEVRSKRQSGSTIEEDATLDPETRSHLPNNPLRLSIVASREIIWPWHRTT